MLRVQSDKKCRIAISNRTVRERKKEEFERRAIKVNFARERVNPVLDTSDGGVGDRGKVSSFGEETANEAILVFVSTALKG